MIPYANAASGYGATGPPTSWSLSAAIPSPIGPLIGSLNRRQSRTDHEEFAHSLEEVLPAMVWRMSTVTFDTLAFSKRLQEAGVPLAQAEAHAQVQAEFLTDHVLSHVATREDMKQLEVRLGLEMQLLARTLTIRLGGMVVLGVGALAALMQI